MPSPALAALATLRWLAEGRAGIGAAAALQKQQEAAAVGAGQCRCSLPSSHRLRKVVVCCLVSVFCRRARSGLGLHLCVRMCIRLQIR